MPAIPQTIADELLPLIFRRQRRPMLGNDLPEQGGYSGNMLAPTQEPAPPIVVPPGAKPSQLAMQEEVRPRRAIEAPNLMLRDELAATPQAPIPALQETLT